MQKLYEQTKFVYQRLQHVQLGHKFQEEEDNHTISGSKLSTVRETPFCWKRFPRLDRIHYPSSSNSLFHTFVWCCAAATMSHWLTSVLVYSSCYIGTVVARSHQQNFRQCTTATITIPFCTRNSRWQNPTYRRVEVLFGVGLLFSRDRCHSYHKLGVIVVSQKGPSVSLDDDSCTTLALKLSRSLFHNIKTKEPKLHTTFMNNRVAYSSNSC